jgi:hypothetical protein
VFLGYLGKEVNEKVVLHLLKIHTLSQPKKLNCRNTSLGLSLARAISISIKENPQKLNVPGYVK